MIRRLGWRVRATLWLLWGGGWLPYDAWGYSRYLADDYTPDGYSPREAVDEDIEHLG